MTADRAFDLTLWASQVAWGGGVIGSLTAIAGPLYQPSSSAVWILCGVSLVVISTGCACLAGILAEMRRSRA